MNYENGSTFVAKRKVVDGFLRGHGDSRDTTAQDKK